MSDLFGTYLKPQDWLDKRTPEIEQIVKALSTIKTHTVSSPIGNLNQFHTSMSNLRENQEYIRTWLLKAIELELEAKRFLALAIQNYKNAMGRAFISMKDKIDGARSMDEKELRLRDFVPEIEIKEGWESILESVKLLKESVDLVYGDLSKASMSMAGQISVIKQQILSGEIRIAIGEGAVRTVLGENSLSSAEKVALQNQPSGEFDLDSLLATK